ncbi:MAG TPA: NAD-dependent epimerase/dehydratase family protein [Solirubrobacteraceae bacterium]|nr:NAD-dependent epimerase/dehydratase family protein [Solirubrobacteraceae bacterium]
MSLVVAVTGPTGEIGKPFVRALERSREVTEIRGMARRPFDPAQFGFKRLRYRQGDVLDREAVDAFVAGADVVVHLAFIIVGDPGASREINVEGSRNVFQAAFDARAQRLVYASSVAAYGFHEDNPQPLTEDVGPRGTERFYYSAQKAELEATLRELAVAQGQETGVYVFRPCIVSGPQAPLLIDNVPYVRLSEKLPGAVRALFDQVPALKPVIPDPGVAFQLVHHDDVAVAMRSAVLGQGEPGIYNLAGPGELTLKDLADALGYYSIPVPELTVDATAEVLSRLPFLPPEARWIDAFRVPVIMDTAKARRALRWRPRHDARATLDDMVAAARERREPYV